MNNNKCNSILQNDYFLKLYLNELLTVIKKTKKEIPFIWEQVLVYNRNIANEKYLN